ncbi:MAG TPA: hypothetical protein VG672_15380 [Bryobacteraceae bacterium]|nr:hypothetical protein [Bryobacteraceae bacterium]
MKRLITFMIIGLATAAVAYGAAAHGLSHRDWKGDLARMSKDLPAFLSYHPTDGNPMRP